MKHFNNILLLLILANTTLQSFAYDFAVENEDEVTIYYDIISKANKQCEVTYKDTRFNSYSYEVKIPSYVSFDGTSYAVTSIGTDAFRECNRLTYVTIPHSVTSIGDFAFYESHKLDTMDLPNSILTIGESAFYYCTGLQSITIPNSVITIGEKAFQYCYGLQSIVLPNSLITIGNAAFHGCNKLKAVTMGKSVQSIGTGAFLDCALESITIPASVKSIGMFAFSCSTLTSITSMNPHPSNITLAIGALANIPTKDCVLYVPIGSSSEYKSLPQWQDFYNITEIDVSAINAIIEDKQKGDVKYYNLLGVPLNGKPKTGVHIEVQNGVSRKVFVK